MARAKTIAAGCLLLTTLLAPVFGPAGCSSGRANGGTGGNAGKGGLPAGHGGAGSGGVSGMAGSAGATATATTTGAGGRTNGADSGALDASADKPGGQWGAPCRADSDCAGGTLGMLNCLAPGQFAGCGTCRTGVSECVKDSDCAADGGTASGKVICGFAPVSDCYCTTPNICLIGCRASTDCAAGTACNAENQCEKTCVAGDQTCPANYDCAANAFCQQRSCTSDAQCAGACVKGKCYDSPGTCQPGPE